MNQKYYISGKDLSNLFVKFLEQTTLPSLNGLNLFKKELGITFIFWKESDKVFVDHGKLMLFKIKYGF